MSNYNTKNYTEQGGGRTVIGGELVIAPGGTFTDNSGGGGGQAKVPYMAASTQSSAANVAKDLNGLIALLKAAGLMAATAPTLSVTAQPEDAACAVNGTVSLSITAACTDGRPLAYQWYSNTSDSAAGGTKITTSGTGADYTPPTNAAGTIYYYCIISDGSGAMTESVAPVTSDVAAVVVS